MDERLVSVERGTDTERFDYTVVALRISLSSSADGEASVRVSDALPNVPSEYVSFSGLDDDPVEWEIVDGNPAATVRLAPGDSATVAYAVPGAAAEHAAAGTATVESVTSVGASNATGGSRGWSKLAVVAVVLVAFGAALVVSGAAPVDLGPLSELGGGPSGTDPGSGPADHSSDTDDSGGDGDGLSEQRESELGTDPGANDTDGDGLDDKRESLLDTDPLSADTDGDGLDDGREFALNADPTTGDTDGDGFPDAREAELGTNPALADTDDDGLADSREIDGPTDAADADTDGDGLPDGAEVESEMLDAADPMHKDVFVEVDYMRDYRPDGRLSEVVAVFRNAPVENPDGSTGIALHVVVDEQIPYDERTGPSDHLEFAGEYFDGACRGYHYATIVENGFISGNDRREGGFQTATGIAVNDQPQGLSFALVFAHELGHDLGLRPTIPGVDSREIPFDTYRSTMNYNTPPDYVGFSDGSNGSNDNDDWATINKSLHDVSSEYYADGVTGDAKC